MSLRHLIPSMAALTASLAACGSRQQAFEPTERVQGHTVEGYREAFYDLAIPGSTNSEVKVWSPGAFNVKTPQGNVTIIRVGFTIDNTGKQPVQLDVSKVRLESIQANGTSQRANLPATLVSGNPTVSPGQSGSAEVEFTLPSGIKPDDVKAFRVRWTTRSNGRHYTEFTPFAQQPEYAYIPVSAYYNPYYPWDYPFYDPFYYDYAPSRVVIVRPYPRHVLIRGYGDEQEAFGNDQGFEGEEGEEGEGDEGGDRD